MELGVSQRRKVAWWWSVAFVREKGEGESPEKENLSSIANPRKPVRGSSLSLVYAGCYRIIIWYGSMSNRAQNMT